MTTKIIEALRDDLAALHYAGVIGKVAMFEFDAIYPPPLQDFSASEPPYPPAQAPTDARS